ncbi:glycosyltransferase family 2 protein [Sporosarcina psychrophila]|uniref:glycosyltransferase family 2 protein n=1 Tax=Sporosarcina psychrophila TaxID=1476 RepID=UPI0030CEC774
MQKNKGILISIIMPTYKRSDFLNKSIDSLLMQDYGKIEIIVVDDNHSNSQYRVQTELKMKEYSYEKRVKYIKNVENLGGALARNVGIEHSTGEYITFLDDDDIYLKDKISSQVEFMIKNNFDMSFMDLILYNQDDELVDFREFGFVEKFDKQSLLKYHLTKHITGTPTFMYKKKYLMEIGGFSEIKMGQEFYLMLKTIEGNGKIGYLPLSKVIAYLHDSERISSGKTKYDGEKVLLKLKKRYFNVLTFREKLYVYFRHHAVIAVVGLRNKDYAIMLKHIFLGLVTSPLDAVLEVIKYLKKKKKIM